MDQVSKRAPRTHAATESADVAGARAASRSSGERLFAGGGETGAQLASIDWANTSLGPVETWPQTLRTSLRICLSSRHAMIIWWGPELTFFYNDAYAPTLGNKRPWAAGKPGHEVWSEIWPTIGPMLERVLRTGEPTWSNDEQLFLERSGYLEETYHTYSYSPIEDETGTVVGVFTAVTETTDRVLAERRTGAGRDLAAALVDSRSTEDVCARAAQVLATDPADVPVALLYGLDPSMRRATLLSHVGVAGGGPLSPDTVALDGAAGVAGAAQAADPWSLAHVAATGQEALIENIRWEGMTLEVEPGLIPHDALALPLIEPGQSAPTAILVAGVSPRRLLDFEYRAFYAVLANHLATALSAAHAYEAERERAEALAEIDRAKTAFFSNVSHEFRTPLTLMLGPLEDMLARRATLPPAEREELELMQRNSMRLLKLVNTLLDFARIEAGRVQASYAPTDLPLLTAELASSFRSLVEKAGMDLVVDCPPLDADLLAPVYVDREMWEKIVLNLLSNAFKFTFTGSITVALRAIEQGRAVELIVRDTGVGIPAAELQRLFERFHRVEGAQSRTHEGSGIGLALVQELVHLHGGTIRAESAEGVGTTFFVSLPTGMAHLPADRVQASVALATTAVGAAPYVDEAERWLPASPSGSLPDVRDQDAALLRLAGAATHDVRGDGSDGRRLARLVLADDNADLRDYLARLLRERYEVEAVANGAQALAAIRRAAPDLVISDVMMPELDGFGLLRELRADPQTMNLPVILLSARAGEEATVEGLEAGADDYLVKPFSARELLSRVAARLEIARMRAEAAQRMHEALTTLLNMAEALVTTPQDALGTDAGQGEPIGATSAGAVRRVLALVQRVLGGRYTAATLADLATDTLTPLGIVGVPSEMEERWWRGLGSQPVSSFLPGAYLERLMAEEVIEQDLSAQPPVRGQDYFDLGRTLIVGQPLPDRQLCIIGIEAPDRPTLTQQERNLARAAVRLVALVVERVRLLREREAARLRELALEEATRRMDEFLGIASHELRTPLTSVSANVQMAARTLGALSAAASGVIPEALVARVQRSRDLLERTNRQTARLDRLVGDLLDTSRIQAGKLELRPEPCELATILREATQEQRVAWPARVITLDIPRHAEIPLFADTDRIGQVVTNFLTNALKYSAEDRPVAVHVLKDGDTVRVEVRDQGPGLTAEQQAHLWERFYRVPGIEQQSGSGVGLGLGLHICKTIIERHGGAVGVESEPGVGSVFWFTLPLAVERRHENRQHAAS